MTQPKTNADKEAGKLSQTTITELRDIYREVKYHRPREFESKYTEKGVVKENDGITLFCRVKKVFYRKNTIRVTNDFLTGEPDLVDSEDIYNCNDGSDIKCCWSLHTMPCRDDKICAAHFWQNQCYMFLTKAKTWSTAYCLVNCTDDQINNEKKGLWYKYGMDDSNEEYIEKCKVIERNMIFNMADFRKDSPGFDFHTTDWKYDIDLKDRVVEFKIKRDEAAIDIIKATVIKSRLYLNSPECYLNA